MKMRTQKEIEEKIAYLKGYINGQREAIAENEENKKIAQIELSLLNWVLGGEE